MTEKDIKNEISPPSSLVENKADTPSKKKGPTLSPKERDLYYLLKLNEPQTTAKLVEQFYEDEQVPFNANKILISRLRNISDKLNFVNHIYKLCKSERTGPHYIKFWLEMRDGGTANYI